jgi:acyl dehydratase
LSEEGFLPVRTGRLYHEFEAGMRFRSEGRTVTEADIILFAGLIGANSPQFLNEEFARGSSLGGRVAPGPLGLSLALAQTEPLLAGTLIALLGVDGVRYHSPIRPGDTVWNEFEVASVRPSAKGDRGIVQFRDRLVNQRGEAVLSCEHTLLLRG